MREPLYNRYNGWLEDTINPDDPSSAQRAQDRAALHRAIILSIESASTYGLDLPVGAVALHRGEVIGRGFANDRRFRQDPFHAEIMAILDTRFDVMRGQTDTLVTSLEPCNRCQDFVADERSIKRVAFGLSRAEVAAMGLVRPAQENIFERKERLGLPYEVVQIDDKVLHSVGLTILKHVERDPDSGIVVFDVSSLNDALVAINNS